MKRNRFILFCLLFIFIILSPYVIKAFTSGEDYVFGGFLLNPIDGNSYLAKMTLGQNGGWKFILTYSANPGEGEFIFLFYIFLGHIARISGLTNIVIFHTARILSVVFLLITLNKFVKSVFPEQQDFSTTALILTTLGSGLGWLFSFTGHLFSDFWVAEAFPFLSSYTSPHFTLGMALLLVVFLRIKNSDNRFKFSGLISGLFISIVMPFGFVVAALVLTLYEIWYWQRTKKLCLSALIEMVPGGLIILYQYYVTLTNPYLSGWNAQNITSSPNFWDIIVTFSPALIFALIAVKDFWKSENELKKLVLIWFVFGLILIYVPFSLQRRFIFSFYIPVAILGAQGIKQIENIAGKPGKYIFPIVLSLSLLTNAILVISGLLSPAEPNSKLFISVEEVKLFHWISNNLDDDALILCSPETGLFVPAYTGRRVVYGHPFETLEAENEKLAVIDFYAEPNNLAAQKIFVDERDVDFIIYGSREKNLGYPVLLDQLVILYQNSEEMIYDAHSQ